MSGTRSSRSNKPEFTAVGLNGHLMHGVHFHRHEHRSHHHGDKPSVGAPSIAGISDVSQSTGHHSHHAATVKNPTPTLIGFGHAGDVIFVFDGRLQIGSTTVHADGTWVFTTPDLLNGRHDFSVGTISAMSGGMLTSNHLAVQVFAEVQPAPTAIATITSALDEFTDPGGNHHQTVIQNGSTTPDTSPKLVGTLSAALNAGEVLYVYRDGKKIGKADVSGNGWSFQDSDVASGKHVYTAQVESASGAHGVVSGEFSLIKDPIANNQYLFPILATEDYLIVDIRLLGANTRGGQPATFDFEESVRFMKLAGVNVESYTQTNDFISFKVDWMGYAASHPRDYISLISHDHVDNANGGLDYYNSWGTPHFSTLLNNLGRWVDLTYFMDGAASQSPLPPVDVHISGIYDDVLLPDGESIHTLIPEGGATSNSTHTVVGTLSGPIPRDGGVLVIYRDGEKIAPDMIGFRHATISGTEWSFQDKDVPPGPHVYTAQIERMYGKQGVMSESYNILEADSVPASIATITSALDEFTDPGGNHHDNVIQNGGTTADKSPKLLGTLSLALHDGEELAIYRDGKQLGHAVVSGIEWSFQDADLISGTHSYIARVESASGVQGAMSTDFRIIESTPKTFSTFPMMATEDFLIFDTRVISRTMPDGSTTSFDLKECVKSFEAAGMTVKNYTDNGGFIVIEVDWLTYAKNNQYENIELVSHRFVENGKGGLNYYNTLGVPPLKYLALKLGNWIETVAVMDGASSQSPLPPATTIITGIYELHADASGNPGQSLIPNGGSSASSSFKIVGTFSAPLERGGGWDLYRDGVSTLSANHRPEGGFDSETNTWWVIDANVPPGPHTYTARIHRSYGEQGDWSENYIILETSPAPTIIATITSALDEFTDPGGNHHQTVIENGSKTADTSPNLIGTLSAALHDGEALNIYRDGVKLGHAATSGLTWSFQDAGVNAGSHIYTACVESASGVQGAISADFSLIAVNEWSLVKLPLLVTEHFLILDIRGTPSTTSTGLPMSFDLTEAVNGLNKLGLAAKISPMADGYICIEVDWMAYAASHPDGRIDFVARLHVDTDAGPRNSYLSINVPTFGAMLKNLDTWVMTNLMGDGADRQSATPAPSTEITGIYDSYTNADGETNLALVPAGGESAKSTHRLEGTLSEPIRMGSDWVVIYRDGVKLPGQATSFEIGKTYVSSTWWFVDTDVPPGPHTYTARVERFYGEQGDWSGGYSIVEVGMEAPTDTSSSRLMLTTGALIVDAQALQQGKIDGSKAQLLLSAELMIAGKPIETLAITTDENGLVSFGADWKALAAAYPEATLRIVAHDDTNDTVVILDKHALSTLLGQMDHWVTMTSAGESAAFFDASDRGAQIHGRAGINTITIADDHQLIDLTSLTGKTVASTIMGIEKIDLGGQYNTLQIALIDALNLGETDLFRIDGKQQLMVNGKAGDSVKLSNTRVAGISDGDWEQQAETKIGGVIYNVYEHSTAHVELMVQAGVDLTLH